MVKKIFPRRKKNRFKRIIELLGVQSDCRACNGTGEQCLAYVTKEASFDLANPIRKQFGTLSPGRGKKRSLVDAMEECKSNGFKSMLSKFPEEGIRHMNALKAIEKMFYKRPMWCKPIENPRSFQRMILDMVKNEADDRSILWFCDRTGNSGKTKLRVELVALHGAFGCEGGKVGDIMYQATEFLAANDNKCDTFVFDFAKCSGDYVSYGAMEAIKNGTWTSTKYVGGLVSIKPPHVICFANNWPDLKKMSMDRWKLYEIEKVDDDYIATEKTTEQVSVSNFGI